ncbi:Alpha/beta hydrolase fold protein OS=Tsukamurella paurometabola (strain ATCC 8368 / DSM / CCUG 35730 / CIP 100753 / JCM 10117 / KCTC 9821 / NBRC 16120 /NCIMB 702349 / NCTC 13040) OX=521096 GN=Tpau_0110 PE=4 SV=1 [Tsukamurella paurometabola]|uniref:alpha/beta fold hydrolase n=1 Tax=Tsukamurella paurometabola TaxID=2061 RepID=UPI0005A55247|nr:alpha/beta hydrolase [Tsukamurella paurometabola]SUP41529.1 acetoin dehydrogenase E2 subunit dihydrolipoyllysine-residue acetyltransferase [Tsukamurella paurometabola]
MLLELANVRTHVVIDQPTGPVTGPPVVLSSGLAGNWFDWDSCIELLRSERTVIRFDRPGYGLSDPWPEDTVPTLDGEVRRYRDLLDALQIQRGVICGHSMASFYVEAFAREHPERTAAAVILDGSVEDSPRWVLPTNLRADLLLRSADVAAASGLSRIGPAVHKLLVDSEPPAEHAQILSSEQYLRAAMLENGQYPVLAHELVDLRTKQPLQPGLPVTVAAAYTGRPTPWAASWLRQQRGLADRLDARFAVIAPSGHHVMVEQPAQVAALILDAGGG